MKYQDVIVSLVNLNGLIHESKIEQICNSLLLDICDEKIDYYYLSENYVGYEKGFYTHAALFTLKDKKDLLDLKNGNTYYIPTIIELELYLEEEYYVKNSEYRKLFNYLNKFTRDLKKTETIMLDLTLSVKTDLILDQSQYTLLSNSIDLSTNEFEEYFELFTQFALTLRSWVNNGYTINELDKPKPSIKKIGRNEPCPCGSGKKYKKCCLNKLTISSNSSGLNNPNVFNVSHDEKNKIEDDLNNQLTKVYDYISEIKEPSLEDLISDISNFGAEFIIDQKPQEIVGSLLFILFRVHHIDFGEKTQGEVFKALRVYGKRKSLEMLSFYIERECLGYFSEMDSSETKNLINKIFIINNLQPFLKIPFKKPFEFLTTIYDGMVYDKKLVYQYEQMAIDILESEIEDKQLELYKICYLFPFLPFVLYEFLPGNNDKEKILILESIIKAFEIRYPQVVSNGNYDFTIDGDNKIYVLSIDSLAFYEKESKNNLRSIELYNKALILDPSDKYGYKEANLKNYIVTDQLELFDKKLNELEKDSLYRIFIKLLNKLIKEAPFHNEYLKAYEKNILLLDAICQNDKSLIDKFDHNAKLFVQDFFEYFTSNKNVLGQLRKIHLEGKL